MKMRVSSEYISAVRRTAFRQGETGSSSKITILLETLEEYN